MIWNLTEFDMIVELKLNQTENQETLNSIISMFIKNKMNSDKRVDGEYIYAKGNKKSNLLVIRKLLVENQLLDIAKRRLELNIQHETLTSLYFNRQAASVRKIGIVDLDDNIPLGPVLLQIVTKDKKHLTSIIKFLTERRKLDDEDISLTMENNEKKKEN